MISHKLISQLIHFPKNSLLYIIRITKNHILRICANINSYRLTFPYTNDTMKIKFPKYAWGGANLSDSK